MSASEYWSKAVLESGRTSTVMENAGRCGKSPGDMAFWT